MKRSGRACGIAIAVAGIVGLFGTTGARAQSDAALVSDSLRRAIVTPDAALLPLPTEVVCGPMVENVRVSPRQNFALVARRTVYPARDAAEFIARGASRDARAQVQEPGSPEVQLLLWGTGSRRAATIWRRQISATTGYAKIEHVAWLPGTDTAVAEIVVVPGPVTAESLKRLDLPDGPKQNRIFLRINAVTGTADTLLTTGSDDGTINRLIVSPTESVAAWVTERGKKVFTIGPRGALSAPVIVPLQTERSRAAYWNRWESGTMRLLGSIGGVGEDGKGVSRPVALDVTTGAVSDYEPAKAAKPSPPIPSQPRLLYTLGRGAGLLTRAETGASVTPLWMEGQNPKQSGRGLLTADMDAESRPVALTTSVLFERQGTLFAVPLVTMPLSEFLTRRQEQWKKDTLLRAKSIGYAAESVTNQARKPLPEPGDFMRAVENFFKDSPEMAQTFNNPATGKSGFTPTYTVTNLDDVQLSAFVVGYLEGPGGRAVIYYGGESKWEDTPPKP